MLDKRHDQSARSAPEPGQTGAVPRVEFNLAVESEPARPLSLPEIPEPGSATGLIPVNHHAAAGHHAGERYGESRDRAKDADDSVSGSAVRAPKDPILQPMRDDHIRAAGENSVDTQPVSAR